VSFSAELLNYINGWLESDSSRTILLVLAFFFASSIFLLFALILSPALRTRSRINEQLREAGFKSRRELLAGQEAERLDAVRPVAEFFQKMDKTNPDSIQERLYRAGFYGSGAMAVFFAIRIGLCAFMFFALFFAVRYFFPGVPFLLWFVPALLYSLLFLMLPGIYLSRLATRREELCRRGFPDFMDMMVVCADAGMSLEAAVEKVASELSFTHRALGIHLKIMTLEVRAGRPLREALHNLAERLKIAEAKTLAVLFRQSEELGTSLTQTLRVYSAEMRDKRIIAAEERANALPVKMVMPLGFCVFPVMLVMIMLPVLVRMKGVFF
jgi:tight adherence protein C